MAKRSFGANYLIVYNSVQLLCWLYLFYQFILEAKTLQINNLRLWTNVRSILLIFQTIQLIEVVHCIIGLVKSSPVITFIQTFTKNFIIWAIIDQLDAPKNSAGIAFCICCWSIAEITRYLFYILNSFDCIPYLLTWCRYSFFIVLYPLGVTGELLIIYSSLNEISKNPNLSFRLPNVLNFSFHSHIALMFLMLLYIPVFPPMYKHLINQRKKIIGGGIAKKAN